MLLNTKCCLSESGWVCTLLCDLLSDPRQIVHLSVTSVSVPDWTWAASSYLLHEDVDRIKWEKTFKALSIMLTYSK